MSDTKGQIKDTSLRQGHKDGVNVLDKVIFSKVFEKDIRRAFIYKKTERIAKALHLISPAFSERPALAKRLDEIALALVEAAALPPASSRTHLTRQLLSLSSFLSVAVGSSLVSAMNADILSDEIEGLLQEISLYEEPSLLIEETESLAELYKRNREEVAPQKTERPTLTATKKRESTPTTKTAGGRSQRQESIIRIIKDKGEAEIKDISTVLRDVSEKTIQRELQALVAEGTVTRSGERRWSRYSLA